MDINAINQVLGLVKDASQYEKQLKVLKDEQQKLVDLIELYSKVNQADMYISKAEKLKGEADNYYAESKAKADRLHNDVMDTLSKERATLKQEVQRARELENNLQAREESVKAREDNVAKQEQELAKQITQSKELESSLEAEKREVTERLSKLKAVMQ